jgi:hypothetical protein
MNTSADNAHRITSHFSWQKFALLKCLGDVWRDLHDDPHWKYERLSPVRALEKSELRRYLMDNDELACANWFWRRRPPLLPVVSSIVWLIVALGLPLIVPVIGVLLLIVAPVIVNTDIVQSARWRRQYELSIDRLIRTSASDRDTLGADTFA